MQWIKWLMSLGIIGAVVWWSQLEDPILVEIVYAETGLVEARVTNTRAGTVTPCLRAKMSLQIGGQITEILVHEGQLVEKGQGLIILWNQDKQAQLAQQEALLITSQNKQKQVCIIADNLDKDARRQRSLLQQKLTSQEELDSSIANAKAQMASCSGAKAQSLAQQAGIRVMQARLAQTYLFAPFSGTVAEITGEVGEYTTPSPPGVATPPAIDLLTQDCHYVSAPIDEVDAAKLTTGLDVRISLDAFAHEQMAGKVRRIAPYVQDYEKQARTVTVEVDFLQHKSPHLLAGYSADVEIILQSKARVLRLPADLIIDNNQVLLLNRQGIIELRTVKTGLSNWQYTEIIEGISKKDKVIASIGLSGVKPGVRARHLGHE